ncbi:MAG: helix-turn-helix domain-containing protein [Candidatus Symbiodolus clandestinus]
MYPDAAQQALLEKYFSCVRHVHHWALDLKSK